MATKLRGHENIVLSLVTTSHDSPWIVSGTEFGEIGLWSLDGSGVQRLTVKDKKDVTSLCCSKLHPDIIYAAVANKVHSYDIRKFSEPVQSSEYNEEEINQICLNGKETFLAACDDSGEVKVINLSEGRVHKTLRKHTNICATVAFHPNKPWELYTGGYDSHLMQWDFSRPRATCVIDLNNIGLHDQSSETYLVNPPFVHSLAVSASGRHVACGTENGLVQLFRAYKRNMEHIQALRGHSRGVSQVHFPSFAEDVLLSGSNDGKILFWDLSSLLCKSGTCNGLPAGNGGLPAGNGGLPAGNGVGTGAGPSSPQLQEQGAEQENPLLLTTIQHGEKINWLAAGSRAGQKFVAVADNTCDLTLHSFPQ